MAEKMLGAQPLIHPEAIVLESELGAWTEVGARASLTETVLGDYSYVIHDSQIIYTQIGKFCSIASFVRINPGNHPLDRAALHHFSYRSRQFALGEDDETFFAWRRAHKVTVGHDVWVGHNATILPGVTVGTGAAIGAAAVVTRDVAPFQIVVGVPARPVRSRFPEAIQEGLLRIAWWNWPPEKLRPALCDFRSLSAAEFIEKYD
jgi:hypothetical protein